VAVLYLPFLISRLKTHKNDFDAVYIWSTAARRGLNPYSDNLTGLERQFGLDTNGNYQANYPPPLIVAFEPITLLSPATAYWVWCSVSILAFVVALLLLCGRCAPMFMVLALFYEPVTDHFLWAQSYTVILLLLVISLRAMTTGRDAIAGLSLAAAGALKLFPLVIGLYAVRTKRWTVLAWTLVGLCAISSVTVAALGWRRYFSFFGSTSPEIWLPSTFFHSNVSVGSIISQLVVDFSSKYPMFHRGVPLRSIFIAAPLAVSVAFFWLTPVRDQELRGFGLWIIIATWIFPFCWPTHMVLFLAFFGVLFCSRDRASSWAKGAAELNYLLGVVLLPIHWTLLIAGPIGWLSTIERMCLIILVTSALYSAWLFSRPTDDPRGAVQLQLFTKG
jgi:hypothetical protein